MHPDPPRSAEEGALAERGPAGSNSATGTIALYLRISEDRSGEQVAVARQRDECHALAARLGFADLVEYVDNDVSATSGVARPSFERMLRDRPRAIVSWHQDRLLRLSRDIEKVIALDVPIYTVAAGTMDLSTPAGRAVARTVAAWTQYEGEQRKERQRAKNAQQLRDGIPIRGNRPFGFEVDRLTLREGEAEYVREACRIIAAGGTLYSVQKMLNDAEVPTTRGNRWSYATIRQMLLRPRNAGYLTSGRGAERRTLRDDLPRIVSPEQFDAVSLILSDPKRQTVPGPKVTKHFMSGVASCGECGARLRSAASGKGNRRQEVYKCAARLTGLTGGPRHAAITRHILEALIPDGVWRALVKHATEGGELAEELSSSLAPLYARKVQLEADRASVQSLENIRGANLSLVAQQLSAIADELDAIDARIADLLRSNTAASAFEPVREFVEAIQGAGQRILGLDEAFELVAVRQRFADAWESLSVEQKRELTLATVHVVVSPADVAIKRSFDVERKAEGGSHLFERVLNPEGPERVSITPTTLTIEGVRAPAVRRP
jgi:DNA invertase Pin-like site-specific DNA recombinase